MPKYGDPEGLVDRLEAFVHRSRTDKSVPWFGTGILDDMDLATKMLRAYQGLAGAPLSAFAPPERTLEYDL